MSYIIRMFMNQIHFEQMFVFETRNRSPGDRFHTVLNIYTAFNLRCGDLVQHRLKNQFIQLLQLVFNDTNVVWTQSTNATIPHSADSICEVLHCEMNFYIVGLFKTKHPRVNPIETVLTQYRASHITGCC